MRKDINVCYVTLSGGNKIIVADFSEGSKIQGASILTLQLLHPKAELLPVSTVISIGSEILCTHNYGKNIAVTLIATQTAGHFFECRRQA